MGGEAEGEKEAEDKEVTGLSQRSIDVPLVGTPFLCPFAISAQGGFPGEDTLEGGAIALRI
jgi:hypothetical protein